MHNKRSEIRQRHLELMETRLSGLEMSDKENEIRERHLGHGVAWGASLGLALGAGLGAALGNLAWGIGFGIPIGAGIGIALGAVWGNKHAKARRRPLLAET